MEKTVSVKTDSDTVKVAVITQQNKIVTTPDESNNIQVHDEETLIPADLSPPQTRAIRNPSNRFNAHAAHNANDETDKAISFINSQDLGWKADTCKFQKHHPEYGSHCDAQKIQQLAQIGISSDIEENNSAKEFGPKGGKEFESAL
jgi:hypothetical protein